MPIYEYKCNSCDAVIEVLQKFSDAPLTTCEKCGGALERLISPPGLHFKGTGWYVTDYARAGKTNGRSEAPTESKSGSKSEPKSESKSESKAKAEPATSSTKAD